MGNGTAFARILRALRPGRDGRTVAAAALVRLPAGVGVSVDRRTLTPHIPAGPGRRVECYHATFAVTRSGATVARPRACLAATSPRAAIALARALAARAAGKRTSLPGFSVSPATEQACRASVSASTGAR
ncbi:hypothetical protein [Dactylosporangium sp. CA-233914]|uniref:hypothetical protein n=1 Tax=Dactylosporangium sp. CA-233914 TaxID=3239934 RepID=UPI003D8CBCC8